MAVAGQAKPSVEMQIVDDALVVGSHAMRQGVVNDSDIAFHRLLAGERVYVQAYGSLPATVEKQVRHHLEYRTKRTP